MNFIYNQKARYNLKVSETEKYADDGRWFKDVFESIVPTTNSNLSDQKKMYLNYQLVNNEIDSFRDLVDSYCDYFKTPSEEGEIEELLPYNRLMNKVNVLVGESLTRAEEYRVILLSSDAIREKDDLLSQALTASIEEKANLEMLKQEQGLEGREAEQFDKENRTQPEPEELLSQSFKTSWELFYSNAIKYCMYDQDIKAKKTESWQDVIIADRTILYVGYENSKPTIQVRNPLYAFFHKNPNQPDIQKGDYVWYRDTITLTQALSENDLSDEDIRNLSTSTTFATQKTNKGFRRDDAHLSEFADMFESRGGGIGSSKHIGTHQTQGLSRRRNTDLIWRVHLEFKAYRKVYFRSYRDEYGKKVVEMLTDDYEIPKKANSERYKNPYGDSYPTYTWQDEETGREYTVEVHHIPRKYEVEKIGNVYTKYREVPMQPLNINAPYSSFELSYKGRVFTDRNAKSVSLVERAIPYQFQYFFVKLLQNRELAKYKSFIQSVNADQIPLGLGQDVNGETVKDHIAAYLEFQRDTNIDLYSGSQSTTGGLMPTTNSPGSRVAVLGTAAELLNLQSFLDLIDREISFAMGISPQREAQFSPQSTATSDRQAIAQSHHITEVYFYQFNELWKKAMNDWLRLYTIYVENIFDEGYKEHFIHYVTASGTEQLFKVTPDHIYHNEVGLWVTDSGQEQRYHETMLQLSHAFAQNAGEGMEAISSITKAITSQASSSEIHKMIQEEVQKQQQRQMEMQQQQQEAQQQLAETQNKAIEDQQAHEIEKIITQEREKRETIIEKAKIDATRFAQAQDINNNQIPDTIELEKVKQGADKVGLDYQKLEFEKKKHADTMKEKQKDRSIAMRKSK